MNERARRVQELFAAALEIAPADRAEFLSRSVSGDDELRAEVASLLAHNDAAQGFLDEAAAAHEFVRARAEVPARISAYEILGLLGEGGMGVVYLARQETPRRLVALKVMREGVPHPLATRRFLHEAEALGRLQHPGIAQIFEAGTEESTGVARPFFALEYVRGSSITEYTERHALSERERLALFAQVCDAIQYAHSQGIVHRDLKPANVLVDESTGRPQAKVLDFGVAHATDVDARTSRLTLAGQIIGTLAYMSPEQAAGDGRGIDARSDVYALGVIAYELLTGKLPLDVGSMPLMEAVRVVQEAEPTPITTLRPSVSRDVGTIVSKALEKDPARRYATASEMGADVRRWLADQPIHARPPSRLYQMQTFARRHRALVVGASAVFVVLGAGVAVTSVQNVRLREEGDRVAEARRLADQRLADVVAAQARETKQHEAALAQGERANYVSSFFQDLFGEAIPSHAGREVLLADVLDGADRELSVRAFPYPEIEADIRRTLGRARLHLGDLDNAQRELESALSVGEHRGGTRAEDFMTLASLGRLAFTRGRLSDAQDLLSRAAIGLESARGRTDAETLDTIENLATVEGALGRADEAECRLREILDVRRSIGGQHAPAVLTTTANLGLVLARMGRLDEAVILLAPARAIALADHGVDDATSVLLTNNLANALAVMGRIDEAEPLFRGLVDSAERVLGPRHVDTLTCLSNLANVSARAGRPDEAIEILARVVEGRVEALGAASPSTLVAVLARARLLRKQSRLEEAESELRGALDGLGGRVDNPELVSALRAELTETRTAHESVSESPR